MNRSKFYTKVIKLYKSLYITRNRTFQDDKVTLASSLNRLRHEFRLNANETDPEKIREHIKTGREVDNILRNQVLQTNPVENKDNTYRLRVKSYMIENNHITTETK
jgi:hypothetical protein